MDAFGIRWFLAGNHPPQLAAAAAVIRWDLQEAAHHELEAEIFAS